MISNIKNTLIDIKSRLININNEILEYEASGEFHQYMDLLYERKKLEDSLHQIENELLLDEMLNCKHIYMQEKDSSELKCIRCGLSNRNNPKLFSLTIKNGILLNSYPGDVEDTKKMYNDLKKQNPLSSDWDIALKLEERINNKVLCKSKR